MDLISKSNNKKDIRLCKQITINIHIIRWLKLTIMRMANIKQANMSI